jgi:uncharacterized protein YegL
MPIIDNDSLDRQHLSGSHYGYSATRIDSLGATEYTLATVVCDVSGSTSPFKRDMEQGIKSILRACVNSPRADNLLVRLVEFDDGLNELHGFKLLDSVNESDYDDILSLGGTTALYDAAENAISATAHYGEKLAQNDFSANAIVFVITDGCDNASAQSKKGVASALAKAVTSESLESLVSILIGVNVADAGVSQELMQFFKDAGFTQYVELEDANAKTLARLADFVSRSISAQSRALGSGGSSHALVF